MRQICGAIFRYYLSGVVGCQQFQPYFLEVGGNSIINLNQMRCKVEMYVRYKIYVGGRLDCPFGKRCVQLAAGRNAGRISAVEMQGRRLIPINIFIRNYMTSPLPFFSRPGTYPYQLQNQVWSYLQGQPLNPLSPMAYQMHRQHAYSYGIAPNYLHSALPPLNFSSAVVRPNLLPNPHAPVLSLQQKRETFNNKIQKAGRPGRGVSVIEISDDSDVVELEGNLWPSPAPPAQMTAVISTLAPKKTVQQINLKQQQQNKIEERAQKEGRPREEQRTAKTRKIAKKAAAGSRASEVMRLSPPTQTSRIFISERIIKKVKSQKEGFRLSKREREMLEITLLRDHGNEIMTGPLFQTRLPPFRLPDPQLARQLSDKRQHLMARLYVEEQ